MCQLGLPRGKEQANLWEYYSEAALSRGGGWIRWEGGDMEVSWFHTSLPGRVLWGAGKAFTLCMHCSQQQLKYP